MAEKITSEQINRMLALNNDMLALRAEGVGIIGISPYDENIQVTLETLLQIQGELEETNRDCDTYPYQYSKRFGGKVFFALTKERIVPQVDVLA